MNNGGHHNQQSHFNNQNCFSPLSVEDLQIYNNLDSVTFTDNDLAADMNQKMRLSQPQQCQTAFYHPTAQSNSTRLIYDYSQFGNNEFSCSSNSNNSNSGSNSESFLQSAFKRPLTPFPADADNHHHQKNFKKSVAAATSNSSNNNSKQKLKPAITTTRKASLPSSTTTTTQTPNQRKVSISNQLAINGVALDPTTAHRGNLNYINQQQSAAAAVIAFCNNSSNEEEENNDKNQNKRLKTITNVVANQQQQQQMSRFDASQSMQTMHVDYDNMAYINPTIQTVESTNPRATASSSFDPGKYST